MVDRDTATIAALVGRLQRGVEQARFAGDDPAVVVAATDSPTVIVAKTLAAERLNTPLRLGDALLSLQEDVAEELFYRGVTALRYWRFAAAQAAFEEAGARTAMPALQQRLALFRAATALLRRVVLADPDQPPKPVAEERAVALVDTLDALAPAERVHYAAELHRLVALRGALAADPYLQTVHGLLRARLALGAGDDTVGLGWLLRAAVLHADRLAPSPYLADLLARARQRLRRFLGEASPPQNWGGQGGGGDPTSAAGETEGDAGDDVRAGELLAALAGHLDVLLGRDVQGDAAQFGIALYHESDES